MTQNAASVVIATRQRAHILPRLIEALAAQQGVSDFEMILIDDGSDDDSVEVLSTLAAHEPRLRTARLAHQSGPAAARNAGWRLATAPLVAFTDDDCVPEPTWLAALLEAHQRGLDVVQGRTARKDREPPGSGPFDNVIEVEEFSYLYQTCNISYRHEVLQRLGGFDESFGFSRGGAPNGEDADLGWRAVESGAKAGFAPDAVVVHPVVPRSFRASLRARLRSARMVYFVSKHPQFRRHAIGRIFFQRSHPVALVAFASWLPLVIIRTWWLGALGVAGAIAYGAFRWYVMPLPGRRRYQPAYITGAWVIDCAELLVMAVASLRWRTIFV